MKRVLYLSAACVAALLGFIGVFVPVLPTTPLLLLAAFCFSRSSERLNQRLQQTRIYRSYVEPFKRSGGISAGRKASILILSYSVMGISAYMVQLWFVWAILAAVAIWLAYLMLIRIPTISKDAAMHAAEEVQDELDEEAGLPRLLVDGEQD